MMSDLLVYYGFTKINKVAKKRELAIVFENEYGWKNEKWVSRKMIVAATRRQTIKESEDGKSSNRMLTKYSIFIDDKPFNSDISRVLEFNKLADSNNVQEDILNDIYQKCCEKFQEYNRLYPSKIKRSNQIELFEFKI